MKDELERSKKKTAVVCSRLLFRNSSGGTEKNNEVFSQVSRSRGKDFILWPPEHETKLLASRLHMYLEIPYSKFSNLPIVVFYDVTTYKLVGHC
jgi:hypothetical protein